MLRTGKVINPCYTVPCESMKVYPFGRLWGEKYSMWRMLKTEMLIYPSKASLEDKSLFGKITDL